MFNSSLVIRCICLSGWLRNTHGKFWSLYFKPNSFLFKLFLYANLTLTDNNNCIYNIIKHKNKNLSYCPERIVQGKSIIELPKLPQIVSGKNKKSLIEHQTNNNCNQNVWIPHICTLDKLYKTLNIILY